MIQYTHTDNQSQQCKLQLISTTMKSAEKINSKSNIHISIDNFSSSIVLPTRQRNSLFQHQLSTPSPLQAADKSSATMSSYSSSAEKHSPLGQSYRIESASIKLGSQDNKQQRQCSSERSLSSFLFHESDSLLKRYNPLYSQPKTQSKHEVEHQVINAQIQDQLLATSDALHLSAESEKIQHKFSHMTVAEQQKYEEKYTHQQHQQLQQLEHQQLEHQQHQQHQEQPPAEQYSLQQQQLEIEQQEQQCSYYSEWSEVFDEPTMAQIYHNYSPSHCDEEEIMLIMQAITHAEQSQKCGKPFVEEAFEHYRTNYGRMSGQKFNLKVVGDVLYLFREHNQKRLKHEKEQLEYELKERKRQKNRSKF